MLPGPALLPVEKNIDSCDSMRSQDVYLSFCLFVLRLNVPVNNFSVMSGQSHCQKSVCQILPRESLGMGKNLTVTHQILMHLSVFPPEGEGWDGPGVSDKFNKNLRYNSLPVSHNFLPKIPSMGS